MSHKYVDLGRVSTLPAGTSVYTMGVILHPGTLVKVAIRGKSVSQRDVLLTSPSGSMKLTLWGSVALKFNAMGQVVVVRGSWVKEHKGVKNLSLPTTGSYEVKPVGVQGVQELVAWWKEQEEMRKKGLLANLEVLKSELEHR